MSQQSDFADYNHVNYGRQPARMWNDTRLSQLPRAVSVPTSISPCSVLSFCWLTVDCKMRSLAASLGLAIAHRPLLFLALPLALLIICLGPFIDGLRQFWLSSKQPSLHLFLPDEVQSESSRLAMTRVFPDGGYFSDRELLAGNLLIAIAWSPMGLDVFHPLFVQEYAKLRSALDSVPMQVRRSTDAFLALWHAVTIGSGQQRTALQAPRLTFPVVQLAPGQQLYIGSLFGNVTVDADGTLKHATYVRMIFDLPPEVPETVMAEFGRLWTSSLRLHASDLSTTLRCVYWNARDYTSDLALNGERTRKWLPLLGAVLVVFAACSCCMRNAVLSKPWLAVGGVLTATCGIVVSQAVLHLLNIKLIQIAMIVPFLVLSIGVDDSFVLLNVWRKSDRSLSVRERLRDTFAEAAVSITITTLTDALVFAVGLFSVFPAIRIFCAHCCLAILVVFVYQLFMFGALLAISGHREHDNRHAITLCKVQPKSAASHGGSLPPIVDQRPWQNVYFAKWHTRLIEHWLVQVLLWLSYVFYVAVSFHFIGTIDQGLMSYNLVPYDTQSYKYLLKYEQHFTQFSTSAEVLISGHMDVTQKRTQYELQEIVSRLEESEHAIATQHFWLRDFLLYSQDVELKDKAQFYDVLVHQFLEQPAFARYKADLVLEKQTEDSDSVIMVRHMRLYLPTINTGGSNKSRSMHSLLTVVNNINQQYQHLHVLVYDVSFPLAEQYDAIGQSTSRNVLVAGATMLVVALVFIPSAVCCLAVALTVLSINLGVLALLAVFGVRLDIISNITVLLSIGFSVDFSSHVTYHFHHSTGKSIAEKLSATLEIVGWPIMQSSLSTLLGVLTLVGIRSYVTETFVLTVVLVMVIGVYHGLFMLPLLLCTAHRLVAMVTGWWQSVLQSALDQSLHTSPDTSTGHSTPQQHTDTDITATYAVPAECKTVRFEKILD